MNVVNWEGSAIFGPGSEWFWSMLQFVVVAITLIGLYRQVRIQASASAFEQLRANIEEWGSEKLLHCRVELLRAVRDGTPLAKLPRGVSVVMLDYWETVGLLVRNQHVSRRLVWDQIGNACEVWWATLRPNILAVREEYDDAMIGEHFEWLAKEMADLDRQAGIPASYDEAAVVSTVNAQLAQAADTLRLVRSLRAPVEPQVLYSVGAWGLLSLVIRPRADAQPPQHKAGDASRSPSPRMVTLPRSAGRRAVRSSVPAGLFGT